MSGRTERATRAETPVRGSADRGREAGRGPAPAGQGGGGARSGATGDDDNAAERDAGARSGPRSPLSAEPLRTERSVEQLIGELDALRQAVLYERSRAEAAEREATAARAAAVRADARLAELQSSASFAIGSAIVRRVRRLRTLRGGRR